MAPESKIEISGDIAALGALVDHTKSLWKAMGTVETSYLADKLDDISITAPIYVSGMARAGSTILLEILSGMPGLASHRYRDFPLIEMPVAWNWLLDRIPRKAETPQERAHKDRILVTTESPEAMEEILWMHFFPTTHDPSVVNVLTEATSDPAFEKFYRDHIRKMLLVRQGDRYLSKGNYNVARLRYLRKIFPDLRVILPVREPAGHVASLIKQHNLFCAAESADRRVLSHMRRIGHFEFGLDLRPINFGVEGECARIQSLWDSSDHVRGWAASWAAVYGYVKRCLEHDTELAEQVLIVPYETFCQDPASMLDRILDHCDLVPPDNFVAEQAAQISAPTYYRPDFTTAELDAIAEETAGLAEWFGVGT